MYTYISIYTIHVRIFSDELSLHEMIGEYYKPFIIEEGENIDIDISLSKKSYFSRNIKSEPQKDMQHFGDNITMNSSQDIYSFSIQEISGILHFSRTGNIHLEASLKPHKIKHLIHIALQGFSRIKKYYNRFLIKTCIHDIVFIALEKKLQSALLHATAVTNGKKTYLFTGLGGSGKSTMASAFHTLKGYTILADNYAIVHGNTLYPFPELPRITKGTQKLLSLKLTQKADGIKNYLMNNTDHIEQNYKIDAIFICSYGENFSQEKIQDKEYIFEILSSIHSYTKEFPEHGSLALLSIMKQFNTHKQRIKNLEYIIENNTFYMLKSTKDIAAIIKSIENV